MSFRKPLYLRRVEWNKRHWEYVVTVSPGSREARDVVVTEDIYNLLDELDKEDRRIAHQIERHNEYQELTDESLYDRSANKPKPMEETVIDKLVIEQLLSIIRTLPAVQAKRFLLRNVLGFTFPEIARMEGCSARAVKQSVDLATKKIRKKMNS